ncbi:MAG TPA: FAD-dependent oxidoreductase [Saprospiraceae bacterium]|nr:FAD-binding oxidoreductase [Saprospiraceae bacterium]HRO08879.1 FAD-dependent oxidoreductase [Saprospiraceae bacterium]HRP42128.1 FAD-dependent oxidoreductase [Saprospiraceae bacterium]
MNYSFWEKYFIESPADITIIGAGIVGLSTAISIKESRPDLDVKIIERSCSPNGASTKNAGFSCFGSVSELLDDIDQNGESACMEIVRMRWHGLKKLTARVTPLHLEYQLAGGTELFDKNNNVVQEHYADQISYLNQLMDDHLGIQTCYSIQPNKMLNAFHDKCIFNSHEGIINPVSMMNQLYRIAVHAGIHILFGHNITEIDTKNHILTTANQLKINYKHLIVCTNGFTQRLLPDLDVYPARNQVLITKPLKDNPLHSGYHFDKGYIYFRQYQGRILLGGGRNMDIAGETTDTFGHTAIIQDYLTDILDRIYPGASGQIECWWSGIMGVGPSKRPVTDWIDDYTLTGVRLGGMGVAIGSYLGDQLAEKIVQKL